MSSTPKPTSRFDRASRPVWRWVYLGFLILGSVVPWLFLFQFVQQSGLSLVTFLQQALANPVAIALTSDLLISTLVFFYFAWVELPQLKLSRWWWGLCAIATLAVGLSCSLPLFLYLRQRQLTSES